ncbi:tyrosine-type recombinase/integrase [Natranaeroarchaeum aerophilus]|uniref:Site-specific integrase n=1 Tax=Natranaeroarchaeum aerophilus TaxID=2917711 RepID=A0AAE3FT17_9EURY|nr:site-specific integrase [Natranaeroarchaeum aerophilus]MCL9814413.1 site-specific integrase [Natranaeroarchaeum aerophilus]
MSNVSGRIYELETELNFPRGENWLRDLQSRRSDGNIKRKRIALEQFDQFLIDYMGVADEDVIKNFETWLDGLYPYLNTPENCGHEVLRKFSQWLETDAGLAHSTIQGRFYDVRTYLNRYHIDTRKYDTDGIGYIDANNKKFEDDYLLQWLDAGSEARKQLHRNDVNWIKLELIEKLIDGAKNFKNEMVIRCLWNFGCRPHELANAKLINHEPENRLVRIRTRKIDDPDHELYLRPVYYSRSMRTHMREWLDKGGRDAYSHASESDNLIVGYNTPSIQARQVNKIVKLAAENAGIQEDGIQRADDTVNNRITAKTLRHSFAVHSVRGVERTGTPPMDIERLRRVMGHESLESTKYYLRFRDIELRDAFDRCHPDYTYDPTE